MGFLDDLAGNVEANMQLFTTFKVDVLDSENNALTIRRYQSGPSVRFIDRSRDDLIGLQVLVRNESQQIASDTIEAITDYLEMLKEGAVTSSDGSYQFLNCDIYIHPLLVEKSDANAYLYSAIFQATIHK
jgi:hypothetical protein